MTTTNKPTTIAEKAKYIVLAKKEVIKMKKAGMERNLVISEIKFKLYVLIFPRPIPKPEF